MTRTAIFRLAAISSIALTAGLLAARPDTGPGTATMFGGSPARNMVNLVDKGLSFDFDVNEKKNLKWVAKLGSRAYGGPTIAGGKIFVGTNNQEPRNQRDTVLLPNGRRDPIDKGILMCFEESTGKFLWQHVNDKLPAGQVMDWEREGICSTPTVEGNRLYYVSNRCEVVCLDVSGLADGNQGVQDEQYTQPTDADVIWRFDMIRELNVFPHNMAACSPLVVGDLVYVVTANGVDAGHKNLPSPDAPSFLAINKTTGKAVWKSNLPGKEIMHGQWSNPTWAVVNGKPQVVFPGGDGWLYGLEAASGKLIWKFDCNPKNSKYDLGGHGTRSDFIATPVVHDGLVYIGTGQDPEHFTGVAHLWCIDPSKAAAENIDLSPKNDNFDPKAPENAKSGLVWHYGGPAKDANKEGRAFIFGRTMSTVTIHDGLVYAGELDGFVHCLEAKTGAVVWRQDLKSAIWGSTYFVDGKILIGTEGCDFVVFDAGREKKPLVKIETGDPIRSTPVVSGGVLYIMTEANLFAISAKK